MKTTKKLLSSFLAVSFILISLLVPMASAADECTIETVGNSVRIIPVNPAFEGNTAREFTFTVPADGEYAVFFSQTAAANGFTVTFAQTAEGADEPTTIPYCADVTTAGLSGYNYSYIRVGAATGKSSSSALTAGECTISITPTLAATINYIDVRNTSFTVDGNKQAIYPSDYTTYSNVGYFGHINGEMQNGEPKMSGYDYFSDYNSGTLTAKYAKDRTIHINGGVTAAYHLNVTKAGNYKIMVYKSFYSYGTGAAGKPDSTGTVTLSVNDDHFTTDTATIIGGGGTDRTETTWIVLNADLAEGSNTIKYKSEGTGSYIYHIIIEENAVSEDKVVTVDNNLTRIEANPATKTIAAGTAREFDFTVPVTGSYIFATQHPNTFEGNISASVLNLSTMQTVKIFDVTWADKENNKYAKIGDNTTAPVTLEAGTSYRLSITPESELAIDYVDVLRTDIPINGKTAIPPYYITSSNMPLMHLNSDDVAGTVIPLDGHTLVGDYRSDKLASPSNGILVGSYMNKLDYYATYTLDVETPGYYRFVIASGQWEAKDLTGKLFFSINGVEFGSDDYNGTAANKNDTLYSPAIYLYSGKQTLTISNKSGYGCGMYLKYLLAEPAETGTGIINATTLPTELIPNLVSDVDGSIGPDGIALDNGKSVSWKVETSDFSADLKFARGTAPENAQISYKVDEETEETVTLAELSNLFESKQFSAGVHTITITSKTDGIVISKLTLNEHKDAVVVPAGAVRTKSDLTSGYILSGSGSLESDSGKLNPLSIYTISYDITDSGYYTVYVTGVLEQNSFNVYFDGADVTTPWYRSTNSDNVSSGKNLQDKRLAVPTFLSAGVHIFTLEVKEGYTATISDRIELRRTDGPLYSNVSDGERVIPAYDFVSANITTDGWYFLHQYGQGAQMDKTAKGYEDFVVRNVVLDGGSGNQGWTYAVTVPEDGIYDFGFYHSAASSGVRITVDDNPEMIYKPTTSGAVTKFACDPLYLTAGTHTVTVRKESVSGTLRLNALSFTKRNTIAVDPANKKANVCVGFDSAVTGKVITAFYDGNKLAGVQITDADNANDISATVENLTAAPDSVKIMVWKDLDNVEPLIKTLSFNTASSEWVVKE